MRPLVDGLEWYEAWGERKLFDDLCDGLMSELKGVEVICAVDPREDRAVRGVGALICDFFGVSIVLLRPTFNKVLDGLVWARAVLETALVWILAFRPAVTKGWRMPDWGLIRLSGSQQRHFETKSTKSSSSQRRTWASVLAPGRRRLPLEFTTGLGCPVESRRVSSFAVETHNLTLTKEEALPAASVDQILIWDAKDLHNARQLLLLIFTREDRIARVELR